MKQEIKKGDLVRLKPPPKDQQSRYDRWRYLADRPYLVAGFDANLETPQVKLLSPDGRRTWWYKHELEKIDESHKK